MIKKCISLTLALLIFSGSMGCYSTKQIPYHNVDEISEGDEITVIDQDMKAYNMIVKSSNKNEIQGFIYTGDERSPVIIPTDQIARIEIRRMDFGLMIILGGIFLGAIIFDGVVIPIPKPM